MALAVHEVLEGQASTIFFGTLHTHADDDAGQRDMVASLHIWRWPYNPAHQDYVFDGTNGMPKLYGLSGIAVGDLLLDSIGETILDELVLTTLDGDLLVYDLIPDGAAGVALGPTLTAPQPAHRSIEDGALGAFNSILVLDLDPETPGNELYVASTLGIRKFVCNP